MLLVSDRSCHKYKTIYIIKYLTTAFPRKAPFFLSAPNTGGGFRSIPLFDPAGGEKIIPSSRSISLQHESGILSPEGPERSGGGEAVDRSSRRALLDDRVKFAWEKL